MTTTEVKLPVITDLNEIKTNGFYQLSSGEIAKADCIGLSEFKQCKLAPVSIMNNQGNGYQLMIDHNDVAYSRPFVGGVFGAWVNLDEVNKRLAQYRGK